jgi:hypothetical protein
MSATERHGREIATESFLFLQDFLSVQKRLSSIGQPLV